jgi:hypothetical protein
MTPFVSLDCARGQHGRCRGGVGDGPFACICGCRGMGKGTFTCVCDCHDRSYVDDLLGPAIYKPKSNNDIDDLLG